MKLLKIELKKAFINPLFFVAVFIGWAITMLGLVNIIEQYQVFCSGNDDMQTVYNGIYTLYNSWIGGEAFSLGSSVFFFVFPLLVALPYGWSYCEEKQNGYRRVMAVRDYRQYLTGKYLAVFLTGGAAMTIPLLINLLMTAMVIPAILPDVYYDVYYGVFGGSFMTDLYYTKPVVYVICYLCIDFIFAGLLACLCNVAAIFVKYRLMAVLAPFLCCLLVQYMRAFVYNLCEAAVNWPEISPLYFLRGMMTERNTAGMVLLVEGLLLAGMVCFGIHRECRHEVG